MDVTAEMNTQPVFLFGLTENSPRLLIEGGRKAFGKSEQINANGRINFGNRIYYTWVVTKGYVSQLHCMESKWHAPVTPRGTQMTVKGWIEA